MKRALVMTMFAVVALTGGVVVASADGGGSDGSEAICEPASGAGALAGEVDVAPAVSGIWELSGRENCYDLFMDSCYSRLWSPSCPANPQGQSCSPTGSHCWRVVSASIVAEYFCQ